jgi:hypothetical protein
MERRHEYEFSPSRDRELLEVLAQLHHQLLELLPYDVDAREAWFDAAARLLAQADSDSQRVDWIATLAWAFKRQVGQGIPISMIIGRLLNPSDTSRSVLLPVVSSLAGIAC